MRRSLARPVGIAVTLGLIALALGFGLSARDEGELALSLPGPGGVIAELRSGSAAGVPEHSVTLSAGGRGVEMLRLQGVTPALNWLDPTRLLVCTGEADVLRYRPEQRLGGATVRVLVSPVSPGDCAL